VNVPAKFEVCSFTCSWDNSGYLTTLGSLWIRHSRSSKVTDFGTNRKRVCDFLLVRYTSLVILHRFWDTATYWLNITYFFLPLSHSAPSLPMFPLEFRAEVNHEEARVMGLSSSEGHMIVASHFYTVPACDRRTDGFTIASTALCICICWRAVKSDGRAADTCYAWYHTQPLRCVW